MTLTVAQVWAAMGGLGVMLLVALVVLAQIATSVPHLVDQRDQWERMAKRHLEAARQYRAEANAVTEYAIAVSMGRRGVTPPPAVRDGLAAAEMGPITRRLTGRGSPDVARGDVDRPTAVHARVDVP